MATKIIIGFVVQTYDEQKRSFVDQEFVAGDEVEYEGEDELDDEEVEYLHSAYLPMKMVQPN